MTDKEKTIYNAFLATSRKQNNKPFKIRKNFSNFETKSIYPFIKRLDNFFNKFPQISPYAYFKAPYVIYPDHTYFDLRYFTSQAAIKAYTLYMKQQRLQSPDSDEHLEFIRQSLKFIGLFCLKQKIPLSNYITHKGGITYSWIKHVLENNVSIYSLLEFSNLYEIISNIPKDELGLLLEDIYKNYGHIKTQYNNSKQAKYLVQRGMTKIDEYVKNNNKNVEKQIQS